MNHFNLIVRALLKPICGFFFAALLLCMNGDACFSQDTSHIVPADTSRLWSLKTMRLFPTEHSPKFAGAASAILPGMGQAYNKKYWKVPIVYAGLAVTGYFIYYNYTIYSNFRKAFDYRADGDSTTNLSSFDVWYITSTQTIYVDGYESSQLLAIQDAYRTNLDLSVIAAGAIYTLNIIDAVVDAHLYDFDVSDDLTMNVRPFVVPGINKPGKQGLTFTMTF